MKIGIIGSGNMGVALGDLWTQAGHEVTSGRNIPMTFTLQGGESRFPPRRSLRQML